MYTNKYLSPKTAFYLALAYLVGNFFLPDLSLYCGSFLAALLIWKANINYLPSLMMLYLSKRDFLLAGRGSFDYLLMTFESRVIMVAGFPVSIPYICLLTVLLRISWEFLANPHYFKERHPKILLILWYVALIPAVIMALQGKIAGNSSWTTTIRIVLTSGGIFYGSIVAYNTNKIEKIAIQQFTWLLLTLVTLAVLGKFHNHILWLLNGFSVPFAYILLKSRQPFSKIIALCILLASFSFGIGYFRISSGGIETGLAGGNATFTLNAIWLASLGFTTLLVMRGRSTVLNKNSLSGLWLPVLILGFTVWISVESSKMTGRFRGLSKSEMTVVERLQAKMFDDRSIIWSGIWENITSGDFWLRPSNDPVIIYTDKRGYVDWIVGAHNTPLEIIRQLRWFSGSIILVIFLLTGISAVKSSKAGNPMIIRIFAIGIVISTCVGGVTGHYLVGADVSIFHFYIAGFVMGIRKRYEVNEALRMRLSEYDYGLIHSRQGTQHVPNPEYAYL